MQIVSARQYIVILIVWQILEIVIVIISEILNDGVKECIVGLVVDDMMDGDGSDVLTDVIFIRDGW